MGVSILARIVNQLDQPFLVLDFSLLVLIGSAEEQVHDEYLVSDHDRDQQDGLVLGVALQVIDEQQQERSVVDDLPRQDYLVQEEFPSIGLGIAEEGVVQTGQDQLGCVEDAASPIHVEVLRFCFGQSGLAAEDVEEEEDH